MSRRKVRSTTETELEDLPAQPANEIAAIDLFIVPTIGFKLLYCLVVLGHARRVVLHHAVTAHPTAEWIARQIVEAFPWDEAPEYLVRDRDAAFGQVVK